MGADRGRAGAGRMTMDLTPEKGGEGGAAAAEAALNAPAEAANNAPAAEAANNAPAAEAAPNVPAEAAVITPAEAAALARILRWRRDVRHFRADPVDAATLERLRAAMDRAPSVGNARPWRVVQVRDPAARAAVRENFARCDAEAAAAYDDARRRRYRALKLAGLDAAPVQLAVFTETDPAEGHGLGRQTMPHTLRQSTAMAIHTLWLAARAENLGLGMVSILDPCAMRALFTAPQSWAFEAYLCIGRAAFSDDTPLLHRADWQRDTATEWRVR